MNTSLRRAWSLLAVVCFVGATACRPNETVEGQAKDAKIKTQIKAKLASDVNAATLTSIQVNVTNGVVTLAGPVHTAEEKSRVETVAQAVPGVTKINNDLQILGEPLGTPPAISLAPPTSSPLEQATPIPTR